MSLLFASLASAVHAQGQRLTFLFHIYVDPLYGDDALAMAENPPFGTPSVTPLGFHPDVDISQNPPFRPIEGRLIQAPYSFRTLNGPLGALQYVAAAFSTLPTPGTPSVERVVIHCLPGLYGAVDPNAPIDQASGLPWNGDVFPAVIPHGVSIRGTSALDTIFDAQGAPTTIFDVPTTTTAGGKALNHTEDFINGVTIRNARSNDPENPLGVGAGVYIHGRVQNQRTISNCFIVGNTVGIAVAFDLTGQQGPPWITHQTRIINNTIAWNAIGIWDGDETLSGGKLIAQNDLQVFNNVFDVLPPNVTQYPNPLSSFEGLSQAQMFVFQLQGTGPPLGINANVNAWVAGFENLGVSTLNWPVTPVFGAPANAPRIDLGPFVPMSGLRSLTILYVNDALRVQNGYDYSRHDFRLAPQAFDKNGLPLLNPLVNAGIALPPATTGYTQLVLGLGLPILVPPGPSNFGNVIDPPATVHCWDWDAEGFGNVRVTERSGFLPGFLAGPRRDALKL